MCTCCMCCGSFVGAAFIHPKWFEGMQTKANVVSKRAKSNSSQMGVSTHKCPTLKKSLTGWEQRLPGGSSPYWCCSPDSRHSWFVQLRVLHVISQTILERECTGSNVNGSLHLTQPTALHQMPSVGSLWTVRQTTWAQRPVMGVGGGGGSSGVSSSVGGRHSPHTKGFKVG